MIESKDILFFVLAFCVLWFTLFLSWLIWQVATILRGVNDVITEAKEKLGMIERAINAVKDKFDHMSGAVSIVGKGLERVLEYAFEKKMAAKKKKM